MDAMMHELPAALMADIQWSVAARPLAGEVVSGDTHVVVPTANGMAVAVVDGLGHGCEAAHAAELAAATIKTYANEPVTDIVRRCHEELRRTRGVVLSLASIDSVNRKITWTGIGNVEGALFRGSPTTRPAREPLLLRGGVVGYSLPQPRAATLSIELGDTLIFATDGIHGRFKYETLDDAPVQDLAEKILRDHNRDTDDALVLVLRYEGAS
jgi:phosphoserine phosphatase RsbX